jgi:hypothetical protein
LYPISSFRDCEGQDTRGTEGIEGDVRSAGKATGPTYELIFVKKGASRSDEWRIDNDYKFQ